jgi:hypothetical protein
MKLTTSQAAEILGLTPRQIIMLISQGKIKAKKLNPLSETSDYLIPPGEVERYKNNRPGVGPKSHRCEPCKHPKKQCSKCHRPLCLNDFPTQNSLLGTKRPDCKDCNNATRKKSMLKKVR